MTKKVRQTKENLLNSKGNLEQIREALKSLTEEELAQLIDELQRDGRETSTPIPDGKYLTVKEVGEYLKVCRTTVWHYSNIGILKPRKVGNRVLFARSEIDSYVQNGMSHE